MDAYLTTAEKNGYKCGTTETTLFDTASEPVLSIVKSLPDSTTDSVEIRW